MTWRVAGCTLAPCHMPTAASRPAARVATARSPVPGGWRCVGVRSCEVGAEIGRLMLVRGAAHGLHHLLLRRGGCGPRAFVPPAHRPRPAWTVAESRA
jgi:hypothetical protein